mmetsp:Transcript_89945/g.259317  ORF Transcript_89945/g.259317 Transcript_89945/m.259317 type:complete len:241 (+) Transcript_89945:1212-1934(+)
MFFKASVRSPVQQTCTINAESESPAASFINSLNALSICSKRFESSGSCDRISSLCMKMGSNRHQFSCTFCHTLSVVSILRNFPLHSSTKALQNSMNLPWEVMPIISSESASSRSNTSPNSPSNGQSGFERSNDTVIFDQTLWMFFNFLSIFASFTDWSTISDTSSANSCSCKSMRSLKENSGPFSKVLCVTVMSFVQCRSCIVSPWRSLINGRTVAIFLASSWSHLYTGHAFTPLGIFFT